MDPLAITTGVLTLLATCITISVELRKLKQSSTATETAINALLVDVNGFRTVLQLMETTFDEVEIQKGFEMTGHIGFHWQTLKESLHDAYETLASLKTFVKGLNRKAPMLDGFRRYERIQAATGQIENYREQIQTYRDAMQFSLHTIIFWTTMTIKTETAQILPDIEAVDQNIDRLAFNLEVKLQHLLAMFERPDQRPQRDAMERLHNFVQSAATVYSSTATVTTNRQSCHSSETSAGELTTDQLLPKTPSMSQFHKLEINPASFRGQADQPATKQCREYFRRPLPSETHLPSLHVRSLSGSTVKSTGCGRQQAEKGPLRRKLVVIGDGACGKTSFLISGSGGTFPQVYVPTVFENYDGSFEVDGENLDLELWDTAGKGDYDRLRPLSYPDTHVVCICFGIDTPSSFANILKKWCHEAGHFMAHLPWILLGLKVDLRNDPRTIGELLRTSEQPITFEQGCNLAKQIGAINYLECSAKTGEGIRHALAMICRASLLSDAPKRLLGRG